MPTKLIFIIVFSLMMIGSIYGRAEFERNGKKDNKQLTTVNHADCRAAHRVGNIALGINNNATFGSGFTVAGAGDCFTGGEVQSCEYPKGSNIEHLFAGAFWIGAIVGRDTAVSLGADGWSFIQEFAPDESPFGDMIYRSNVDPENPRFVDAVSEEDYISTYSDTFTAGIVADIFGQPHIPLYVGVTERSYAWSYSYAEDFVLFDYSIKNVGIRNLEKVYMGFYVDADVGFVDGTQYSDDIAGFLETIKTDFKGCEFTDTVNVAWTADMDGDFNKIHPSPDLTAMRIVRTPAENLVVSFNWWISHPSGQLDFGPREKAGVGRIKEDFRNFGTGGLGTPEGDRNKYYIMSNGEFDYDQAFVGTIKQTDPLWLYPPQNQVADWAGGLDTRYLLSFGPFDIRVGQTLPISFAYMGGKGLHTDRNNATDNMPHNPQAFYDNMHFEDLALNSTWAERVYDNPGVDTDNDGYFGEFRVCSIDSVVADTDWYRGDGIPDFTGAAPPPPPIVWLSSGPGYINVRFNGTRTETVKDIFSREVDFEGYRIYIARDERSTSYSVIASYDRDDYNMFVFDTLRGEWDLSQAPFLLDELRSYFRDDDLDPLFYSRSTPYTSPHYPDMSFYFEKQDFNVSDQGVINTIRKKYPDQPYPSSFLADSARPEELTEDGYLKYFEYEYIIEDLLPTVEYYVNVTAFDFGSPGFDLGALESSITLNAKSAYAQSSIDQVLNNEYEVTVYPNPYRLDAQYSQNGFEGRGDFDWSDDRLRKLHFANIPPICKISIYSIDGDLIREIDHDVDPSDPKATHETWNLITRNTQMIVSGLYYYVIEADNWETHIGKFSIIM